MNVLSLCTGYGGLDMAVEEHFGAVTRWVSDIDRDACAVQAVRFPDAEQLGDLKAIDWSALAGQVDIATAGYPCQPFSTAGRRKGVDDPRHIWPWILRGIRVLRPRLCVFENVSGHLGLGFDRVLGDLAAVGFDARWVVVRASDVGAPHRRERLFVVAADAQGQQHAEVSVVAGREAVGSAGSRTVDGDGVGRTAEGVRVVGRGARSVGGAAADPDHVRHEGAVAEPLGHDVGGDTRSDVAADADGEPAGRHAGTVPGPQGEGRGVRRAVGPADGVRGVAADADGTAGDVAGSAGRPVQEPGTVQRSGRCGGVDGGTDWGQFTAAVRRWEHLTGREAPPPLVAGTKQLNARFVEWMMGLPDGWVTDVVPNRRSLKTLGNGVVPQQAEMALRRLLS